MIAQRQSGPGARLGFLALVAFISATAVFGSEGQPSSRPGPFRASGRLRGQVVPADAAPSITSPNSATFTIGTNKTFTVTTTGSPTPALGENGALPDGVTFLDNADGTATLSGNAAGTSNSSYSLTISASNGAAPDATQSFTLRINHPPVANPDSLGTFLNMPVSVSTGALLDNDTDPDNDIILLLSVAPSGGPNSGMVSLNGGTVTYTLKAGFTGQDTFSYSIGDGRGGVADGTVTVTIGDESMFQITSIVNTPEETDISGTAVPGGYYVIQICDEANGTYTDFSGVFQPASDGSFFFNDITTPHPTQRFYRVRVSN
jgi:hypothetical protein